MPRYKLLLTIAALFLFAVALRPVGGRAQKASGKSSLRAGQTFKDCRNCPEMVVIPAGSFMMGSPATEAGRRDNEPQSMVTIAHAFAVSKTEVTWDQWEACVRDRGCDGI